MTTTFPIAPSTSASWALPLLVVPIVLALLGALYVLGAATLGSRHARFEVGPDGLTLRGDLYGRTLPRATLRTESARVVDLEREPNLRPIRRTFGSAFPGYRSGWFRLADGEKALLYVTDRSKVVYVPTSEGYALLLSAADPTGLVASLRALGR